MYNCIYYYVNDCILEIFDNVCILCIIIYLVKEDIIIFFKFGIYFFFEK